MKRGMGYNNLDRKLCDTCGLEFQPKSGVQKVCNRCNEVIRSASIRRSKVCIICKERFAISKKQTSVCYGCRNPGTPVKVSGGRECIRCESSALKSYEDGEKICIDCGKLQTRLVA